MRRATSLREAFLPAGELAVELIRDPAVEAAWQNASALPRMSVGGLAAHLAFQITAIRLGLDDRGDLNWFDCCWPTAFRSAQGGCPGGIVLRTLVL
jgi:hypothetical protein